MPLTTLTGSEFDPTFSPDGEQVAFSWNGTRQDNWDIYVTLVGSSDVRRLTSDPAEDAGRRGRPTAGRSRSCGNEPTIPPFTSSRRSAVRRDELGDFRGADSTGLVTGWSVAGGRELRTAELRLLSLLPRPGGKGPRGIYLVPVDGGAVRPLIVSNVESCRFEAGLFARRPAPRVRLLRLFRRGLGRDAGLRCGSGRSRYVARHGAASPPADDAAVRVYRFPGMDAGRQRHHLRCCRAGDSLSSLWRVAIDGNRAPERIEDAGEPAAAPALARSRDRLAFTRMSSTTTSIDSKQGGPVQLVAGSSFVDERCTLVA